MLARRWMGVLLAVFWATPSAWAGDKEERAARETTIETQVELRITRLVPLTRYQGTVIVTHPDPRFVLEGRVIWSQRERIFAKGSRQAFAIHSPTRLGLSGARPGDSICLLATRIRADGKTRFTLTATKPDAGCRGGG